MDNTKTNKTNKDFDLSRKNKRLIFSVFCIVFAMVGLAYASVPLYRVFCQVTGFGGTTQISRGLPENILAREMTVRFDTNVARDLPWNFKAEQKEVKLHVGARGFASFIAENKIDAPVSGTAVFNVTPLKAGKYFQKIECFCFGEQILNAREQVHMPVVFYIDPAINDDVAMQDVSVITLSYSFLKSDSQALEDATQKFYEEQNAQE